MARTELSTREVIISKIIKMIAKENLTIDEAEKVLYQTSQQIKQQIVQESFAGR